MIPALVSFCVRTDRWYHHHHLTNNVNTPRAHVHVVVGRIALFQHAHSQHITTTTTTTHHHHSPPPLLTTTTIVVWRL
jgi:tRNA(Met) C34 N-acetyltransferase TmcA